MIYKLPESTQYLDIKKRGLHSCYRILRSWTTSHPNIGIKSTLNNSADAKLYSVGVIKKVS